MKKAQGNRCIAAARRQAGRQSAEIAYEKRSSSRCLCSDGAQPCRCAQAYKNGRVCAGYRFLKACRTGLGAVLRRLGGRRGRPAGDCSVPLAALAPPMDIPAVGAAPNLRFDGTTLEGMPLLPVQPRLCFPVHSG